MSWQMYQDFLNMTLADIEFTLKGLRKAYAAGATVSNILDEALRRATEPGFPHVWTTLLSRDQIQAFVERLDPAKRATLPLFGVPFAIKDSIDLAGVPTTLACREFAYTPGRSATVVDRLVAAGAIPLGKANLDQFATGLVGTRSAYGICQSVFDSRYISGGSSSGSAVAVAAGMVPFALGTDTAGSGRVPAAFNHVVGLKPTRGVISTTGLFPACRTLDCISIFAGSCADVVTVLDVAVAPDETNPYSRTARPRCFPVEFRFGVPAPDLLQFFGDTEAEVLYAEAVARLEGLGGKRVQFDFMPFRDAAALLYAGPWVAERRHALGDFFVKHGAAMDPTVREIIAEGEKYDAVSTFDGIYRLQAAAAAAQREWRKMDLMLLPTTGTTRTIAEIATDPIRLNSELGYYTNFANLLDLTALAVPAGFRTENGLPFGVTLLGPAFTDAALLAMGDRLHKALGGTIGVTSAKIEDQPDVAMPNDEIQLAVVGAHLAGQPLNYQLTRRGARLIRSTKTSGNYRLFALANTNPPKPGLVRTNEVVGDGIAIEVWALSPKAFGHFVAEVPAPMTIGSAQLADGSIVKSFLCESGALDGAREITHFGGWLAFLAANSKA
jgi:allophanate hydrolase